MGKWCLHASLFIFDRIIIIKVAGNQDRHKSSDEFDFGPLVSMANFFVFWNEIWLWHIGLRWAIFALLATFFFFSSCSVYYRYITYILQVKNMKLLRIAAPSIHMSLKLILADKKKKIIWFHTMSYLQLSMYCLILKVTASPKASQAAPAPMFRKQNCRAVQGHPITNLSTVQLKILLSSAALHAKTRGARGIWSPRRSHYPQNQAKCNNRTGKKGHYVPLPEPIQLSSHIPFFYHTWI